MCIVNCSKTEETEPRTDATGFLAYIHGSIVGAHFIEASLDTCSEDQHNRRCLAACRQLVSKEIAGVVISGEMGTGKTHLLIGTIMDIARLEQADDPFTIQGGIDVMRPPRHILYWKSDELASLLREGSYDIRDQCKRVPVLAIDDLGTEHASDFIQTAYQSIFDARYENRRSTIITTNLTSDEIDERYTQRVMSRWQEAYSLFHLGGPDRRARKAS